MTQPDQALSVRQILDNFTGRTLDMGHLAQFYGDENMVEMPYPDLARLDLAEVQLIREQNMEVMQAIRDKMQADYDAEEENRLLAMMKAKGWKEPTDEVTTAAGDTQVRNPEPPTTAPAK